MQFPKEKGTSSILTYLARYQSLTVDKAGLDIRPEHSEDLITEKNAQNWVVEFENAIDSKLLHSMPDIFQ